MKLNHPAPRRPLAALLALALLITLLPAPPPAIAADAEGLAEHINNFNHGGDGDLFAEAVGNTVTVTGAVTGANTTLVLDIDGGVTVVWKAEYEGAPQNPIVNSPLISLVGSGTFEVAEGADIYFSGENATAIYSLADDIAINVTGGIARSDDATAKTIHIGGTDSVITVSGGLVTGAGDQYYYPTIDADNDKENVIVTGGIVEANSTTENANFFPVAIYTMGSVRVSGNGTVMVNGDTYPYDTNGTGRAIFAMGTGSGLKVTVAENGTVIAFGEAFAIEAERNYTVDVKGGLVEANHGFQSIAILSRGGTVNISDGAVRQVGAANTSNSNAVRMSPMLGTMAASGGALTVSGGLVTSGTTTAISTNNTGTEINITGGLVFSWGNAIVTPHNTGTGGDCAISAPSETTINITAPGSVVVWARAAWNSNVRYYTAPYNYYVIGSDEHLRALPAETTVRWNADGTIGYGASGVINEEIMGEEVTVGEEKIPLLQTHFELNGSPPYILGAVPSSLVSLQNNRFNVYNAQESGALWAVVPPAGEELDVGEHTATVTIAENMVFTGGPFAYDFTILPFSVGNITSPVVEDGNEMFVPVPPEVKDVDDEPVDTSGENDYERWEISEDGGVTWTEFEIPSEWDRAAHHGRLLRYSVKVGENIVNSNTVPIRVYSADAREVTVEMWTRNNDYDWYEEDGLSIVIDGATLPLATKNLYGAGNNPQRYTFFIDDEELDDVAIYWSGYGDDDYSFAVYYSEDSDGEPIVSAFNRTSGWSDPPEEVWFYVRQNTLNGAQDGQVLYPLTVTYQPNGGAGAAVGVTGGWSSLTVEEDVFEREGYLFKGWNTSADGSGAKHELGGRVTEDMTLYAQWARVLVPGVTTVITVDDKLTDAVIVFNEEIADLLEVSINDNELALDPSGVGEQILMSGYPGYSGDVGDADEGSVILTLYKEFLRELPNGKYTLLVWFEGNAFPYDLDFEITRPDDDDYIYIPRKDDDEDEDEDEEKSGGELRLERLPFELPEGEDAANWVAALIDGDGYVVIPYSLYIDGEMVFLTDKTGEFAVINNARAFDDTSGHWAERHIAFVSARGVFNGGGGSQFDPGGPMTRAMFVTALWNLENKPEPLTVERGELTVEDGGFEDVLEGAWYYTAVTWAAENGVVSGYGNGLFGPEDVINREQMAVMLANYIGFKGFVLPGEERAPFEDGAEIAPWAADAVRLVSEAGIVSGKPGNLYGPKDAASRAEVSALFANFITVYLTEAVRLAGEDSV
ncbi:MAG: S-layer homology domain-containing protein [Oscillospiraceae bacterium]|nr:S-layer homology domain-containing protein [Oscillospiraceae bacterium]